MHLLLFVRNIVLHKHLQESKDHRQMVKQRDLSERRKIEFKEQGVIVTLLAEVELPFRIPNKVKESVGKCVNCPSEGMRISDLKVLSTPSN